MQRTTCKVAIATCKRPRGRADDKKAAAGGREHRAGGCGKQGAACRQPSLAEESLCKRKTGEAALLAQAGGN